MIDQSLIRDFIMQTESMRISLGKIVEQLGLNIERPKLFEQFGQQIDAIYGVLSMINVPIFAEYTLKMKEMCYKCSRSDSEKGRKKSLELMKAGVSFLGVLVEKISNPEELEKINFQVNLDLKKIERTTIQYFNNIKMGSIQYEEDTLSILIFEKKGGIKSTVEEAKKKYYPAPIFANAPGGYRKELARNNLKIAGIVIDTELSSNIWLSLIEQAHMFRPGVPILLINQDKDIFEEINKGKLNIQGVITRPKDFQKLIDIFKNKEGQAEIVSVEGKNVVDNAEEFIDVLAVNFTMGYSVPFSVYLRLDNGRHLKIVRRGDSIDEEQLLRHQSKGIAKYYVEKKEFNSYLDYCREEVSRIFSDSSLEINKRKNRFLEIAEETHNFLQTTKLGPEHLKVAEVFTEQSGNLIAELAKDNKNLKQFILDLEMQEHAVSVALMCGVLLKEIDAAGEIYNEISLAAFLHDIALINESSIVKSEDVRFMDENERAIFLGHPSKSAAVAKELGLKPAIVEAIAQHHMRLDDSGFPKLKKGTANKVNRIAELIGLAEDFLLLLKLSKEDNNIDPFAKMSYELSQKFSITIQKAYRKVFAI